MRYIQDLIQFWVVILVFTVPTLSSPGQTVVVAWNFPQNPDDAVADSGSPVNAGMTLTLHGGAGPCTFDQEGYTSNCAAAQNWADGALTKFWQIECSTEGYGDLTFESWQASFSPQYFGPADFLIQYRIGGSPIWTTFSTFHIPTGNHWFQHAPVSLPEACENQQQLFIRWLMLTNEPTQGSGLVNDSAWSQIDNIYILSYCPYPDPPGPITGPDSVCLPQAGLVFSIDPIPNAVSYTWTYSGTGVTINGSGTSVTLGFSQNATSGTLAVFGTNPCGNGPVSESFITVNPTPIASAEPVSQTICPASPISVILLSTLNNIPGTTFSWVRDNTIVLTGIPDSGNSNPISGTLYSSLPQQSETTTFTITAEANGCSSVTTSSVTVQDNEGPYFLVAPDSVYWCVQDIVEAWWDGTGDINPERPDYHTFIAGNTIFDLDPSIFYDNCTSPGSLILHWQIILVGGMVITGSGQISGYPQNIQFPLGDNIITYWLEDASGNLTPEALRPEVIVTVLPRPDIVQNF